MQLANSFHCLTKQFRLCQLASLSFTSQRQSSTESKSSYVNVSLCEVRPFIERALTKVGAKKVHAETVADCLFAADYRGHFSHGLQRLGLYVNELRHGSTVAGNEPQIEREHGAVTMVDGNSVLGAYVGEFCMQIAIDKAKKHGISLVSVRKSNHFGICAFYTLRALDQGLIGISMTNSSPIMQVTRSRIASLGTLPISIAAPVTRPKSDRSKQLQNAPWRRGLVNEQPDDFVLDMATTTVAFGKVEMAAKRGDKELPDGWSTDSKGNRTNKPQEAMQGYLLPLGIDELHGSYKGYGLAMAIEILCGVLANAAYGPMVRSWTKFDGLTNLGQCFAVIDPNMLSAGFGDRVGHLVQLMRSLEPLDPTKPVLIPGDPEREHMNKCDSAGSISYHANVIANLDELADEIHVARIKQG